MKTLSLCPACFKPIDYSTEDAIWISRCSLSQDNPLFISCGVHSPDFEHTDCIDNPLLAFPLHADCYHRNDYWKANRIFIDNAPDRMVISSTDWGGRTIADCGTFAGCDLEDAHLLAAAPDLLEACKETLIIAKHKKMDADSWLFVELCEKAIAKAEG